MVGVVKVIRNQSSFEGRHPSGFSAPLPVGAGGGAFVLPPNPQIANLEDCSFSRSISFSAVTRIAGIACGW